jgi:hypothetical protein
VNSKKKERKKWGKEDFSYWSGLKGPYSPKPVWELLHFSTVPSSRSVLHSSFNCWCNSLVLVAEVVLQNLKVTSSSTRLVQRLGSAEAVWKGILVMPMTNAEVTNTAAVSVNGYFVFICTNDGQDIYIYHLWCLGINWSAFFPLFFLLFCFLIVFHIFYYINLVPLSNSIPCSVKLSPSSPSSVKL